MNHVAPTLGLLEFRSLRGCEKDSIREFYGRLSPRTRYLRFFSPMPVLPDAVLNVLACGDDQRRLTLLAQLRREGAVEIVALGNVGPSDDGDAELGLVVRDDFQRQGIGTLLAARVLRAAEARGFDRFVGYVLWENSPIIRKLLAHVADIVSATTHQGVSEMHFVRRR
jgi:GNAT superfamily N-acetyltransferase